MNVVNMRHWGIWWLTVVLAVLSLPSSTLANNEPVVREGGGGVSAGGGGGNGAGMPGVCDPSSSADPTTTTTRMPSTFCSGSSNVEESSSINNTNEQKKTLYDVDPFTDECTLYLAPSSIQDPRAGFGVFTADDIPKGRKIGVSVSSNDKDKDSMLLLQDMILPIIDQYKTLPYRGQQRFKSWLGYIYPETPNKFFPTVKENSFPVLPKSMIQIDEGLSAVDTTKDDGIEFQFYYDDSDDINNTELSVFLPGIASLVNSNSDYLTNIDSTQKYYTIDEFDNDGVGVGYFATKNIPQGSELFIDYGASWYQRYHDKYIQSSTEFETLDEWEKYRLPNILPDLPNEEQRRTQPKYLLKKKSDDFYHQIMLVTNKQEEEEDAATSTSDDEDENVASKTAAKAAAKAEERVLKEESAITTTTTTSTTSREDFKNAYISWTNKLERLQEQKNNINRKKKGNGVAWLHKNGMCIDNLRYASTKLYHKVNATHSAKAQTKGAFAMNVIKKGHVIAPAPLLTILRDDLTIYGENKNNKKTNKNTYRDTLDMNNVVGYEGLINYAYGHVNSSLLLVPNSPIVNFINHNHTAPNAEIRWPQYGSPLLQQNMLEAEDWLKLHPLDVVNYSGKIYMEFVALRDIQIGEEILIDYGVDWMKAYDQHIEEFVKAQNRGDPNPPGFRHEIGVPDGFFPNTWLHQSSVYQPAAIEEESEETQQEPQLIPVVFDHNGMPISSVSYMSRLPKGFSDKILDYANTRGIVDLYKSLLYNPSDSLGDNEWFVFNVTTTQEQTEQWFAQRYESRAWRFNIHYVAAYNEEARTSILEEYRKQGLYDTVLQSIGNTFQHIDNMTCFHTSFMGISEADNSFTHADVYATDNKGFNIIYPIITVNDSKPELDIIGDDINMVISVKYLEDMAYVIGDYAYHKTSPIDDSYVETNQMRVVVGTYCAQIDHDTSDMIKHLYNGEPPAPFMDQFLDSKDQAEVHWSRK